MFWGKVSIFQNFVCSKDLIILCSLNYIIISIEFDDLSNIVKLIWKFVDFCNSIQNLKHLQYNFFPVNLS